MSPATEHIPIEVLLQDWLGENDAATRETVDAHLMACDECGALLDELVALRTGVAGAVRAGIVRLVAGAAFVDRLAAAGVRIREYRLGPGGSVNCSVAPEDEVLVSRLQAPLQGVQRVDLVAEFSVEPAVLHLEDVPFDAAAGEVLLLYSVAQVREMPAHTVRMTLLAHEGGGSRELGRYEFRHSPWGSRGG